MTARPLLFRASDTSWAWALSVLLACGAVALSFGLRTRFVVPKVDWLPDRAATAKEWSAEDWQPRPSVAVEGWLPESRWNATPAFDVHHCLAPVSEILDLPPGPEDIPALDEPQLVTADKGAEWLGAESEVIGVDLEGSPRCFDLAVLRWHNVVNDLVNGRSLCVVFDPLSGASLAFSRRVSGERLSFAVSGKAYNGCALLYDREHRNLWYPLLGECLAGPWTKRASLTPIPAERTTWAAWRRAHPNTLVLSRHTGFDRPYEVDPYSRVPLGSGGQVVDYWTHPTLILARPARRLPNRGIQPKALVLGLVCGQAALAVVAPRGGAGPRRLQTQVVVGGQTVAVALTWDPRPASRCFQAETDPPPSRPPLTCFWFAWLAAHPATAAVKM